jgi:Flp pilus assembly protein TadD
MRFVAWKRIASVIAAAGLLLGDGFPQQGSGAYQNAVAAYAKGDFADAAVLFAQAEAAAPSQTDAQLYEGLSQIHIGHPARAESALLAYLQGHPDSFRALEALGALQEEEDKPADSLRNFTRAAAQHTPSAGDLDLVARDYVLLNDYPDAIHWLQKATVAEPGDAAAWYDLGRCYYTQSLFSSAQHALLQAQALRPDSVRIATNLGLTLDAENRSAQAEAQYKRAVALAQKKTTSDKWPFFDFGTFLLEQARPAEAIPQLRAAVAADPNCAQCHALLGRALAQTGNSGEGIKELEKAVALSPGDASTHYQLGRLYRSAGKKQQAQKQFALSAQLYGAKSRTSSPD